MSLQLIVEAYRWLLQPSAPFTWLGYDISTLDLAAALRLCVVLRQLRDMMLQSHVQGMKGVKSREIEPQSLVKSMSTTLIVVYGGEVVVCESSHWAKHGFSAFASLSDYFFHRSMVAKDAVVRILPCRTCSLLGHNSIR